MHSRCFSLPTFRGVDVSEREMKKAFGPSGYVKDPDAVLEDMAESAYWEFDARRAGMGKWQGMPQSERDAFKAVARRLIRRTT